MPGLDEKALNEIDFALSIKRIVHDVQTDFIVAPHINSIYHSAAKELIDRLRAKLHSGQFDPALPINIEVPNSVRKNNRPIEPFTIGVSKSLTQTV